MSVTDVSAELAQLAAAAPDSIARPCRARALEPFRWLIRPRRVLIALAAVWVINVFDLGFTILEAGRFTFVEMNPVAANLIHAPPYALAVYKFTLLSIGTVILLSYRRHRVCELACWFVLAAYVALAFRWSAYYDHVAVTLDDPVVNVCPVTGALLP